MIDKIQRCAIYIRVSTSEQMMHGKSLEAQKEYLVSYAKERGMTVVGIYADEGKTARKELRKRKAIHSLVESVKQDEVDVIIFWKLDRWFRNMSDFYKIQDILDEYGVHWISVSEPGINMETRDGRLQLNVVLSIGQNEVDTTSERIKFVNEASIRQGKLIFGDTNMPLGYKAGNVDGVKRMVKDPATEHIVEDFFQHFMKHQGKCEAMRYIKNTYGIDFSYSRLRTMVSSEFYKGTYRGIPYCPAYLSEKEWNKIQEISSRNIKHSPSGRIYLFTGLMRCPVCGNLLSGTGCSSVINRKTKEKKSYCYYRCNRSMIDNRCTNRHRTSQNLIEQYLINNFEKEYKKYKIRSVRISEEQKKKKLLRTPHKIKSEMDRLNLLFQKDRIEWNYYCEEYDRLSSELSDIESEDNGMISRDFSYLDELIKQDFRSIYEKLTPENRRAFWRSSIKEIYLNEDHTVKGVDFL